MSDRGHVGIVLLLAISTTAPCPAADAVFQRSQIFILSENQDAKATLTLSDTGITIQGQKLGGIRQQIPYAAIVKMKYESVSHHRISQGFKTASFSPGVGAIIASTRGQDHWLAVDFNEGTTPSTVILRLDKKEYRAVTAALTAKTGKPVELLDTKRDSLDPTVTSSNVDETVAFPIKKVAVALRHSMDRVGCNVQMETSSSMQCRRKHGNSSLIGPGGETVTASLESQAAGTRIRIVSKRTAVRHRNWSTPIYAEMKRELESLQ